MARRLTSILRKILLLIFLLFLATGLKGNFSEGSKIVFVRGGEIWTATGDGLEEKKLTTDNRPKSSPIWSPDGKKIASSVTPILSLSERGTILAEVDIVDTEGKRLLYFFVPRKFPEDGIEINSFADLEWIDISRLGYVGYINPSLSEYRTVDAETGSVLATYLGTKHHWSPDKSKIAYLGWRPHFYRDELVSDYVEINGKVVFSSLENTVKYAIESPLTWSPDSKYLALIAKEKTTEKEILVVLDEDTKVRKEIPLNLNGIDQLIWDDGDRIFLFKADNVWAVNFLRGEIVPLEGSARDDALSRIRKYESIEAKRTKVIQSLEGTALDWWPK